MILYACILFSAGVLLFVLGMLIYRGNTNLIHDYHQTKIKEEDKEAYGRDFSKGMFGLALTMFLSGGVSLFGETKSVVLFSEAVLFAGIIISIAVIVRVQKKYNGGVF